MIEKFGDMNYLQNSISLIGRVQHATVMVSIFSILDGYFKHTGDDKMLRNKKAVTNIIFHTIDM